MPNIRPATQYIARMNRVEGLLLRDIYRVRADFRREALDVIATAGVKITTLPVIRGLVNNLRLKIQQINNTHKQKIDEITAWYMNQQLGSLRSIGEKRLPNIQQLNLETYTERSQIYENVMAGSMLWIDSLSANMQTNLTRLAATGASVESAISRLFSVGITDGRASVFRLSGVAAEQQVKTNLWTTTTLSVFGLFGATSRHTGTVYQKQWISAIDHKTTDCCLQAHGQIQPLDKPFHLTGEPRFSDFVDSPPGHWNCRAAMSLYKPEMEEKGIPTAEMKDAADAELTARATSGTRERIWPSSATSRR